MINRFDLGKIGLDYFSEGMRSGLTLARAVSSRKIGRVYALLPSDTDPDALNDFSHGGKLQAPPRVGNMQQVPNTDAELAELVIRTVDSSQPGIVVLEDEIARPSDFATKDSGGLLFENDEVYHLLDGIQSRSKETFLDRLSWARSTATLRGFVATLDAPIPPARDGRWAPGELSKIASQTRLAFLSAYDGESYLIAEFS